MSFPKDSEIGNPQSNPGPGRPLERRQLTIMFTDLIDSTGLADSMDPEDFRLLIEAHRTIAVAPILRYGGVVARYLGDGMLILFGYPEAHEDDPERAVRAGLEVAKATESMNARWVGEGKGRISVRIGVHTGIVIIGDVLKADVQEIMAVFGNAPSLAARLQALAKPNGVILSGATKALLPSSILCEARGNTTLKGIRRPVEIFAAVDVREGARDRHIARAILPFVNRETELATIRRSWAAVRRGEGRCLMIEGDPGIGKSRLIRAVEERIITQPSRWLITRTSPYAVHTDFFAFSELFHQLLPIDDRQDVHRQNDFDRLQNRLLGQGLTDQSMTIGLANLLGINVPEGAITVSAQPERMREHTLNAITGWLQYLAAKVPLVLVIEDLHWSDASSLEVIDRLKADLAGHAILLILTTRTKPASSPVVVGDKPASEDVASKSAAGGATKEAVAVVGGQVRGPSHANLAGDAVIHLDGLRSAHAEDLLHHVLGGADLPKAMVTTLLKRANGVPLFLEELPKPVLEAAGEADGAPITLPATLRDSLMAQLDRMGQAKIVAQTASVLGHSFERSLLERVWDGDARVLETGLATLSDAALIKPDGDVKSSVYGFRHALLAEIAYDSLLRDDRRRIHQRTADILAEYFRPLTETRPELLARHHEAAASYEEAFTCWLEAGKAAFRRSANIEAFQHFKNADAALAQLALGHPEGPDERRLALLLARGPAAIALSGWSAEDVEDIYQEAFGLAESLKIYNRDLFAAGRGLFNVSLLRGELLKAEDFVEHLTEIATGLSDDDLQSGCRRMVGICDFLSGRLPEAVKKLDGQKMGRGPEGGMVHEIEALGTHPSVIANSIAAWSYGLIGNVASSERCYDDALRTARKADHAFSIAYALCLGASVAQCCDQPEEALERADEALEISAKHQFPYWQAWGGIIRGWALANLENASSEEGMSLLRDGLERYADTGATQIRGYALSLLAECHYRAGRWENAFDAATGALVEMKRTGIHFYLPEARRIAGECLIHQEGASYRATAMMARALRAAQQQRSLPMFERAARSLIIAADRRELKPAILARAQALIDDLEGLCPEKSMCEAIHRIGLEADIQ